MGLLGFGIGMGFRTVRYTARALTPRRRYYRRSCARQQQSDSGVAFGLIAIVFFLLVFVAAANGGSNDPTSKYGPPGRYGYGYTWDGHIVPLNSPPKPPGTYVDGHPTPIVVTFPAPRPAAAPARPQPTSASSWVDAAMVWLLLLGVPIVMARTIMHPRNRWNWLSAIAATAIAALWVSLAHPTAATTFVVAAASLWVVVGFGALTIVALQRRRNIVPPPQLPRPQLPPPLAEPSPTPSPLPLGPRDTYLTARKPLPPNRELPVDRPFPWRPYD